MLDSIAAGEPTYDHLTQAQVNQLEDMIVQYETWLNQQMMQQNPRPQTSDPVVKVTDIVSQQQVSSMQFPNFSRLFIYLDTNIGTRRHQILYIYIYATEIIRFL